MKIRHYPKYSIGIDIGGTKTKAVLCDNKKTIVKNIRILTPNTNKKLKRALSNIVKKLKPDKENFSIGVCAAGAIKNTSLLSAPNIFGVKNFDFKKIFPADIPLLIDNDARCFLKSEIAFNPIKKDGVFGLTIGTGIGRAYAKNNAVQKIKRFEYPELWEKEYQKIKSGKDYALLAEFLGQKLSLILKRYNPKIIIIGGGVLKNKKFLGELRREFKKQKIKSEIKHSKLGENSIPVGATFI